MDFGPAPAYRECRGPDDRQLRIAFGYQTQSGGDWDRGNWSYVGTDASTAKPGPTINIGYAANMPLSQLDPRELRRLILHEVGHALGLEHEHQSPLARCEFDWAKVVPYYKSQYEWDEAKTKFNLERLKPVNGLVATPFDPASIMNYGFPAWMFVQTVGQPICEIQESYEPSQTDLASYAAQYPGPQPTQAPTAGPAAAAAPLSSQQQEQQARAMQEAQQQQDRVMAERAARAVAVLQQLLPVDQRQQAAEIIGRIAQQQFSDFKMNIQGNSVTVGNVTTKTDGPCSPAIVGVGGNVTTNANCTTTNSTIGTQNNVTGVQNNVQGNQLNHQNNVNGIQLNNSGTFNNQGGINLTPSPR